jgi:putative DNA primase/helicase
VSIPYSDLDSRGYDDAVKELSRLHPHEYEQVRRVKAKQLKHRLAELDADVRKAREANGKAHAPQAQLPPDITDTDLANAKRLSKRHGADLHFTKECGWMVWDGRRWSSDEKVVQVQGRAKETAASIYDEIKEAANREVIFRHAKHSQSKQAIDAMMWLARSEPRVYRSLLDFDADGWLFNVANGTLNLRTGRLQPHRREDLISRLAPVSFEPGAGCELWDAFLWRVTDRDEELYGYLRRFIGYLLAADVSDQSLHFLYGRGSNGKSVLIEVLLRLLGDYAVVVSPDLIMLRKYSHIPNDVARLRGIRLAVMNETQQGQRFDEAKLKDLTGGDKLDARFLHQEFFDFNPTHRLVIRGNHKPSIVGTDEGIWRRLRLVPFKVAIPPEERDPHLAPKLIAELPGILQWAIAGCLEYQRDGLKPPAIVLDAVRQYREESDVLGRFIAECCEQRKLAQVKSSSLFSAYREFCERAGERWMSDKELPEEMQRRGFSRERKEAGSFYFGIELKVVQVTDWRTD